MSSVSAQKKNPVRRGSKTLSTSQARANFADALGMAQEQSTVIGFDRYGRLVAAVVPIDAVRMLAGRGKEVEPTVRAKIARMARSMLHVTTPASAPSGRETMEERAAVEPKSKEKSKEKNRRRKDKREKKKKKAKAASGKRPRRISRKI